VLPAFGIRISEAQSILTLYLSVYAMVNYSLLFGYNCRSPLIKEMVQLNIRVSILDLGGIKWLNH
jgi:hypothetical protein